VILEYDPNLSDIYTIVGAVELTPATAVRRFTLPSLGRMSGPQRLEAMAGLAERWGAYKGDAELIQTLKAVAFVPAWDSSSLTASSSNESAAAADVAAGPKVVVNTLPDCHYGEDTPSYRAAAELLSWTNADLLDALRGPHQSRYFAPPSIRSTAMQQMLTDLGMEAELKAEQLLKIAKDIEASSKLSSAARAAAKASGQDVEAEDQQLSDAHNRGRRLLRVSFHSN
jgi:hypothetical protein